MTWHGPRSGCGCCKCSCSGGGESRKFANTPTVKVVVSGLPASYEWSQELKDPIFGAEGDRATTVEGLHLFNGTYFSEAEKTTGDCIDFYGTLSLAPSSSTITETRVSRGYPDSSGCYTGLPDTVTSNITTSFSVTTWDNDSFRVNFTASHAGYFLVQGTSFAACKDDFDASLSVETFEVGVSGPGLTGPGSFGSATKNSSEQKIWLGRTGSSLNRCLPVESYIVVEIGSLTVEVLDL